jgi:hypothetical protein
MSFGEEVDLGSWDWRRWSRVQEKGSRLRWTIGVRRPNWTICRLEDRVAPHGYQRYGLVVVRRVTIDDG